MRAEAMQQPRRARTIRVRLIAGRVMLSDYNESERICCRLELERDCLRMTLGPGLLDLHQVQDVHLRRLLLADFEHAKKRLPEVECELLALKAFGQGTPSLLPAAVVIRVAGEVTRP
jgi:hypothetical protein